MRRFTPLGLVLAILACIVAFVISTTAVAKIMGDPIQIFHSGPTNRTVEIWFSELDGQGGAGIGNDTEFRVATIVGPERAVTVICPAHFTPDLSRTYLANEKQLETSDGRLAPPVWTLIVDLDGYAILPRR